METVLFIIAALTASTPMAAAILVSIASRREDNEWTLGEPNVPPILMIARRILDYRTDYHRYPQLRSRTTARSPAKAPTPSQEPVTQPDSRGEPAAAGPPGLLLASR